jgi:DnaJ-class molecular chaperone
MNFLDALALIPKPAARPALQIPCDDCNGTGAIVYGRHDRIAECETCEGTGEVDSSCEGCGGVGPAVEVISGEWRACEACVADERTKIAAFDEDHARGLR